MPDEWIDPPGPAANDQGPPCDFCDDTGEVVCEDDGHIVVTALCGNCDRHERI